MKRQLVFTPIQHNQCVISTVSADGTPVLPIIAVMALPHTMEITVTDLAGKKEHLFLIRQNGDVEVDP